MNQFDQAPVNGEAIEKSIAIVCNGNTAPKAIAAGQYLFIKNHSTLATGGYHATDAIASGDTLSSSNVTSDPDGFANAINGNIPAVVNNLTSDSTTDALSAAQGKALNGKVNNLYSVGGWYIAKSSRGGVGYNDITINNIPNNAGIGFIIGTKGLHGFHTTDTLVSDSSGLTIENLGNNTYRFAFDSSWYRPVMLITSWDKS